MVQSVVIALVDEFNLIVKLLIIGSCGLKMCILIISVISIINVISVVLVLVKFEGNCSTVCLFC